MTAPVPPAHDAAETPSASAEAAATEAALPAPVTPPLPDRGDAPVSEVTERFLRAVMAQIPVECVEELHLFSPLRQGTVETGIAVVAVRHPVLVEEVPGEPELPFEVNSVAAEAEPALETQPAEEATTEEITDSEREPETQPAAEAEPETEPTAEPKADADVALAEVEAASDSEVAAEIEGTPEVAIDDAEAPVAATAATAAETVAVPVPVPLKHDRLTVYTARYRYIIKGPERGKWEASVTAEADAPLITVETVVRGVQRRAGEESEIVRYTSAQIVRVLRIVPQA
jgi:hypothetical protein